jgi:5-methylcytosine-specific restriction endonuclease McrA
VKTVLEGQVLVLNRHWVPIQVTVVKEAIGLVAKGHAKIIDAETYQIHDLLSWADVTKARQALESDKIHSVRLVMTAPEVIMLTTYEGMGERSVVFSRRNVFKRDHYTCQYCAAQPDSSELTIDHIVPKSKQGKSTWENCVLACIPCNKKKADRTVEQAGMKLRKIPKKPTWKALIQAASSKQKRKSWDQFVSDAYWDVELKP